MISNNLFWTLGRAVCLKFTADSHLCCTTHRQPIPIGHPVSEYSCTPDPILSAAVDLAAA